MQSAKQVLVRTPNWIGDSVMAMGALERLSRICSLTIAAYRPFTELFSWNPAFTEIIPLDHKKDYTNRAAYTTLSTYDSLLLLTNSFSSAYGSFFSHIPIRAGYTNGLRSLFMTHTFKKPAQNLHHTLLYDRLADLFASACLNKEIDTTTVPPAIQCPLKWKKRAAKLLGENTVHPLIIVAPGAAYGSAKQWPLERFKELITVLLRDTAGTVVIAGTDKSSAFTEFETDGKVINLIGKTSLADLIGVIALSDAVACNDSGVMHITAALRRPLAALFGSTDPALTGPSYTRDVRVIHKPPRCAPCFKRKCPYGEAQCLLTIVVDEVAEAVQSLL